MKLHGRRILIAGSADPETPEKNLQYAHALVSELAGALAESGANFVVAFGTEPRLKGRQAAPRLSSTGPSRIPFKQLLQTDMHTLREFQGSSSPQLLLKKASLKFRNTDASCTTISEAQEL